MTLPASFAKDGFLDYEKTRGRRRIMIGSEGLSNSGKSEFALSMPGPGIALCLDRGIKGLMENQNPPPTRQSNWAVKIIKVPKPGQIAIPDPNKNPYLDYWRAFYSDVKKVLANADCLSLLIDGDSDSWELQRMAVFGKVSKVPSIQYTQVNTDRRALYAMLFDSEKNIVATNKLRKHYVPKLKNGRVETGGDGKPIKEWDGTYERQGFEDQGYLWDIQLRHMRGDVDDPERHAGEWGIRILECKPNVNLVGFEMWGDLCNFSSLVESVYPHIKRSEWGF